MEIGGPFEKEQVVPECGICLSICKGVDTLDNFFGIWLLGPTAAFDAAANLKGQEVVGTGEVSRGRKCNGRGGAFGLGVGDGRV
eukprot:scaffold15956_cov69-Cylindrotheca_fusiformis.AAC.1